MEDPNTDRRVDRSEVRIEALHKFLDRTAMRGDIDLLVIGDDTGGFVASGGSGQAHDPVKIAAFGGHLADIRRLLGKQMDIHDTEQVHLLRRFDRKIICRYFHFKSTLLILISLFSHTGAKAEVLDDAVEGCLRILEAKDLDLED